MAKKVKNQNVAEHILAMRRGERAERVAALADGRRTRAHTFADRKRVANKRACRGRASW